jgi:hypothetical protein
MGKVIEWVLYLMMMAALGYVVFVGLTDIVNG